MTPQDNDIVSRLRFHAAQTPDKTAFKFLGNGDDVTHELTFQELTDRMDLISVNLQMLAEKGDRALMLMTQGLEFVAGFMACLNSGLVAVPLQAPRKSQAADKVLSVLRDCAPTVILTDTMTYEDLKSQFEEFQALRPMEVVIVDRIEGSPALTANNDNDVTRLADPADMAFIQYTSGSTGKPKGVCVTHGNIMENSIMIEEAFQHDTDSIMVGWLPMFHDMGLIGNVIQPLYTGFTCITMPSVSFLQKPLRWLKAISRFKATSSGGPNFGFELLIQKFTPERADGLDLSSWRVAFNGSEPVRAETLNTFTEIYSQYGFHHEAHFPCYGMAESTLFISGADIDDAPTVVMADRKAYSEGLVDAQDDGDVQPLVACGHPHPAQVIRIVNPDSLEVCPLGAVGEIWVSGPNIAESYYGKPELTEATLQAKLASEPGKTFLRTGDLGFLKDGQIYISGRIKDVMIFKGRNIYPQDIEMAVASCHPAFMTDGGAAFDIDMDGKGRLIAVQEVKRVMRNQVDYDEVLGAARAKIAREFELQLHDLVLILQQTMPRTSSGKVRRSHCKSLYLGEGFTHTLHKRSQELEA